MMDIQVRREQMGSVTLLSVTGELDLSSVPDLRNELVRLVGDSGGEVVAVDLDGVVAIDDTCIGMLLGVAGRAREAGGDVVLVCSDERLLQRFALLRFDRAIDIVGSVHDISRIGS